MFVCYDILAFRSIRPRRGYEQGRLLFLALGCGAGRRQASLQPCQQLLDIASLGQLRLKVCDLLLALGQRGVSSSYIQQTKCQFVPKEWPFSPLERPASPCRCHFRCWWSW